MWPGYEAIGFPYNPPRLRNIAETNRRSSVAIVEKIITFLMDKKSITKA